MDGRRDGMHVFRLFWLAALGLAAIGAGGACSTEEEAPRRGQRGESCAGTADCAGGLACVLGTCSVQAFELTVTEQACVRVQCREAADCWPDVCSGYEERCDDGEALACAQFESSCNFACQGEKCERLCETDGQCLGQTCVSGRCTECARDDDCFGDDSCIDNVCISGCKEKADCPIFHDCENAVCVFVGCASDRECIAATGTARATCQEQTCVVPCSTDIECDSPSNYGYSACVSGRCRPIGCETDAECRILLGVHGTREDAECRPQTMP
jgi:hypothetical protein